MEDKGEKLKLMTILKKMVILRQRDNDMIVTRKDDKDPKTESAIEELFNRKKMQKGPHLDKDDNNNLGVSFNHQKQNMTDGYWIVLQDWSQCNQICGGGTTTLHRMCVPPKQGGKACEGEALLVRKCNPQKCPDVIQTNQTKNSTFTMEPTVRIMPFSSRPQRYSVMLII